MNDGLQYPELEARDRLRAVSEAVIAAVPGGSVAIETAEALFSPSVAKRRDAWARSITDVVNELSRRGVTPDELAGDEEWISAVFEASRQAFGTHLASKLQRLRSILVRMAAPGQERSEAVIVDTFLRFVDELGDDHFRVLAYGNDPRAWLTRVDPTAVERARLSSRKQAFAAAKLGVDGVAQEIVLRDLNDRGLLESGKLSGVTTANATFDRLTTDLGAELIAWVTDFE